jgi:hypothetical protein
VKKKQEKNRELDKKLLKVRTFIIRELNERDVCDCQKAIMARELGIGCFMLFFYLVSELGVEKEGTDEELEDILSRVKEQRDYVFSERSNDNKNENEMKKKVVVVGGSKKERGF